MDLNDETKAFFNFITHPTKLESLIMLEQLIKDTKDENLRCFWKILSDKNLECFRLTCKENNTSKEVYYIDLETPILFYPVFQNHISLNIASNFFSLASKIKSNLLNFYSQEVESSFILIKKGTTEKLVDSYTFKVEDQDIKLLQRSNLYRSRRKEISQKNLDNFLKNNESMLNNRLKKDEGVYASLGDHLLFKSDSLNLQNGKKRFPVGQRNPKNRLNLLTGREWIKFSKTWFIHRPPSRKDEEFLHPAKFPETLIRKFITFFTKPGELVLDPFLGTGSALIAAKQSNRSGVGIELSPTYAKISKNRLKGINSLLYPPLYQTDESCFWKVICGDSRNLNDYWEDFNLPTVDFCITSPPYWNQLQRNTIRQRKRKHEGLDTQYSYDDPKDLGNIDNYNNFLSEQQKIFGNVYEILRPNGYLVIITNHVFTDGQVYPLAYDTVSSLINDKKHNWIQKDEKIWLQDDKSLVALGVNYAWVGNRCHQYCLILRKEVSN